MLKNKIKASLVHLSLSIVLVSLIMVSVIYFWFPLSFTKLTDFKDIAILIIAVDLVLGPVLTFVVFNPAKKSIVFDLSVIAMIQVSALAYGSYALFQIHPLYIVFAKDRFSLVAAIDSDPYKSKYKEYNISKLAPPKLAYAQLPENIKERNKFMLAVAMGKQADLEQRMEYYEPFENHISDIIIKSLNPEIIFSDKTAKENARSFLKKHGENLDDFAFLPLDGPSKDAIIVIDRETAKPITNLNIDPWKYVKK